MLAKLRAAAGPAPPPTAAEVAAATDAAFASLATPVPPSTAPSIPRFYFPQTKGEVSEAGAVLQREARLRFLGRELEELADGEELDAMWQLLYGEAERVGGEEGEVRIGYAGYVRAREAMDSKVGQLLTASAFYEFEPDAFGRVPIELLAEYAVGRASLRKTRIMLSVHDHEGSGHLTEADMERFIFQSVQDLPCLQALDPTFHVFYVCTAVRKFFFFLDPMRLGRIAIKSILLSPVLSELFELEDLPESSAADPATALSGAGVYGADPAGDDADPGVRNWFSPTSARRVYAEYLRLDVDHNGMLSRSELAAFGSRTLTPSFLDRVFEECHTYGGEMDYKTYLDFVLAMENKAAPESLAFFFRLLDINKTGKLTAFVINYFFKDVQAQMRHSGYPPVSVEDVKDEIFDMVNPKHPLHITLADLVAAGVGETVVNILTDTSGFWCYDNREMLVAS